MKNYSNHEILVIILIYHMRISKYNIIEWNDNYINYVVRETICQYSSL